MDDQEYIAGLLGVGLGTIGESLWRWLDDLDCTWDEHQDALEAAARQAAMMPKQVGYFKAILPGYLADAPRYRAECDTREAAAERQATEEEARAEARRVADEIESYREMYVAARDPEGRSTDFYRKFFGNQIKMWREKLTDAEIVDRLPALIEMHRAERAA